MPRTLRRTALPTLVALGALAAPAGAHTFCVGTQDCTGGTPVDTVQQALDAARGFPGADTVRVGAGDYTGPFSYAPNDPALSGPVRLRGAGRGSTRLQTPQGTATPALQISASGSELSDLTVSSPDRPALVLTRSALVEDVSLHGTAGLVFNGGAPGEQAAARRVHIKAEHSGATSGLGVLRLDDSLVELVGDTPDAALYASSQFIEAAIEARHVTLVGAGGPTVGARAVGTHAPAAITLRDSIVSGFGKDMVRLAGFEGAATIDARWTRIDGTSAQQDGPGAITLQDTTTAAPAFSDPTHGDFSLTPESPLIDGGDPLPDAVVEGTPDPVDLAGNPRVAPRYIGGLARRDMGAYEALARPEPQPEPAPGTEAPQRAAGSENPPPALTLTLAGRKRQRGRKLVVRATPSETVKLVARGRLKSRSTRRTVVRDAAAGEPVRLVLKLPRSAKRKRLVRVKVRAVAPDGRVAIAARMVRALRPR